MPEWQGEEQSMWTSVSSTEADSSKSKLYLIFSFNEIEKSADKNDTISTQQKSFAFISTREAKNSLNPRGGGGEHRPPV